MDVQQFREFGKAAVDYIADYIETLEYRPVLSTVKPGYLEDLIPMQAPQTGEPWQDVLRDVDQIIVPGLTHWHSPHFHAFFPTGSSLPSIIGEMMSAGFSCVGLSWIASPAYTELEVAMMNWLGKLLNLPEEFLNCSEGPGGGIIQGSASETTFIALLAAKEKIVKELLERNVGLNEGEIKGKLVAYSSNQSNSSVEKAGLLGSMPVRLLPCDNKGQLRGETLREAIRQDKEKGLIPCYVIATLGTTQTCAFDKLEELGPICHEENLWLHIDAAYAGSAFICPEYRHWMKGIEYAQSFNFNPHKWMLVNFDCSAMWVKNAEYLVKAFNVERIYLKDQHKGLTPEYRHWQIPLGRRFRALKLWFVLRIYGVEGIQKHLRKQVALAKHFEELVRKDSRFEIISSNLGLVCFRLIGADELTIKLVDKISERKTIYIIKGNLHDKHVIRFAVCSRLTELRHIDFAWDEIQTTANEIMEINCGETLKNLPTIEIKACQNITNEKCDDGYKRVSKIWQSHR